MSKGTKFNKELINQYVELLQKKYKELEGEEFSFKARNSIKNEIEECKALLVEESLETTWDNLSAALGVDMIKPVGSDHVEAFDEDLLEAKFNTKSFASSKNFS